MKLFEFIGRAFIIVLVSLAVILYNVWAVSIVADNYWNWFIMSTWPTAPNPTQHEFIAILLVIAVIFTKGHNLNADIKEEFTKDNRADKWAMLFIMPWTMLLIGYLLHLLLF